jgi:predicted transposase/invertase (TIGR01784 family)
MKNDLLRVLSIFSPRYQITLGKEKRFIEIDEAELNRYKDKLINLIIRRLSLAKEDNKLLTALDIEIDYENRWERLERERNEYKKRVEQERKEKEEARKQAEEIKERLINTAKIMKNQGIDIETIKQATGLSEEEIKKL